MEISTNGLSLVTHLYRIGKIHQLEHMKIYFIFIIYKLHLKIIYIYIITKSYWVRLYDNLSDSFPSSKIKEMEKFSFKLLEHNFAYLLEIQMNKFPSICATIRGKMGGNRETKYI